MEAKNLARYIMQGTYHVAFNLIQKRLAFNP